MNCSKTPCPAWSARGLTAGLLLRSPPSRSITQADLATVTERVRRRVIRWFRLAHLFDASAAADMLTWGNSGVSIELVHHSFCKSLVGARPSRA